MLNSTCNMALRLSGIKQKKSPQGLGIRKKVFCFRFSTQSVNAIQDFNTRIEIGLFMVAMNTCYFC